MRIGRRSDAKLPAQYIGKPALGVQADDPPHAIRVALRQIFSQAIARGMCENNPASELGAIAAPTPKAKQYPHLLEPELPAFLQALRRSTSRTPARVATWLVLWTASRPGVVRYAEWTEIDFERAMWSIPADKMKARRDHVTPLCRQALDDLRERLTSRELEADFDAANELYKLLRGL